MNLINKYKYEALISIIFSIILGFFLLNFYKVPYSFYYEYEFNDSINIDSSSNKVNIKIKNDLIEFQKFVYSNQKGWLIDRNPFNFPDLNSLKWINDLEPTMDNRDLQFFHKLNKIVMDYNFNNQIFDSVKILTNETFPNYMFFKIRLIKYSPNKNILFYDSEISKISNILANHLNNELKLNIENGINNFVKNAIYNEDFVQYDNNLRGVIEMKRKKLFEDLNKLQMADLSSYLTFNKQIERNNYLFNHFLSTIIFFLILIYLRGFLKFDKRSN